MSPEVEKARFFASPPQGQSAPLVQYLDAGSAKIVAAAQCDCAIAPAPRRMIVLWISHESGPWRTAMQALAMAAQAAHQGE